MDTERIGAAASAAETALDLSSPSLIEITRLARAVFAIPFECLSRFVRVAPGYVMPDEVRTHLAEGGGLGCFEKALLLSQRLTEAGVENAIICSGYEWWADGVNLLKHKGSASRPLEEVEAKVAACFAPDRTTSAYEVPIQLSHWANWFSLDGQEHLIDVTGQLMPFRLFSGVEVAKLLDRRPKAYLEHGELRFHLYYHRISDALWQRILHKAHHDAFYVRGRILGAPLAILGAQSLQLRWWWRDEAMAEELARADRRGAAMSSQTTYVVTLEEAAALVPALLTPRQWAIAQAAWPMMRRCLDEVFDSPKHVRLAVGTGARADGDYASETIFCPDSKP